MLDLGTQEVREHKSQQLGVRNRSCWPSLQLLAIPLDYFQYAVESVKALLEVEVRSILPVQDVAEIAWWAECCLKVVVAHLAFSSPSHSLPELESVVRCMSLSNSSSGSYEGVGEEEQSLAVRFRLHFVVASSPKFQDPGRGTRTNCFFHLFFLMGEGRDE